MKNADRSPLRWFQVWRPRPLPLAAPDPADCGTAFGLDLSTPGPEPLPRGTSAPRQGWRVRWAWRRPT